MMTNFDFIGRSEKVLKGVADSLRGGNKEYTSISRVLKDIQRKEMLKAGYGEVFAAVGLEAGGVKPADFFAALHKEMWGVDKKGNKFVGLWGWKVVARDKDGKPTKKEAVLRKVTSWSPNKFFKVVAQSQELSK